MKRVAYILVLLLTSGILLCCSDEEQEVLSRMYITENFSNDGGTVAKTDVFNFSNKKLINHTTLQEFYGQSISGELTLSYSGNEVTQTDMSGNTSVYTLNSDGYATQCVSHFLEQIREYRFTYDNGYLTQVDEQVDGTYTLSNFLTYVDGNLTSISDGTNKWLLQPSSTLNYSQLPCLQIADSYPLSFHLDAVYAHLLGKPTQHLVQSVIPDTETPQEETVYSYQTDATGKVNNIQVATTYTGIVIDPEGNVTEETSTIRRNLSIRYE